MSDQARRLDDARAVFRRWQHMPDTGALDTVLGAYAANRHDGDPVWVLLIASPGGGKTELLNAVSRQDDAYPTATLTEAALLSGTPRRERDRQATGGLLREIGERGIIVCKDFGSVLSMNRDARSLVLAALREVYDGAWTRHVGTDGGKTLSWSGRVGLIGACTQTIDRHHAVMAAMGERLALYRLPQVDPDTQARQALGHAGREQAMRDELAAAVAAVLEHPTSPSERTDQETDLLVALATFAARARSSVERDGYSREIELVPDPEAPTRLTIMLARLLDGLDAIGCERNQALRTVRKVALDSIPALRLAVLHALQTTDDWLDTNSLAEAIRHPAATTRRTLEDLNAHLLVDRQRGQRERDAHHWKLSTFAHDRLTAIPEMSSYTRSGRDKGVSHTPTFREQQHPPTDNDPYYANGPSQNDAHAADTPSDGALPLTAPRQAASSGVQR